jgi:predicted Rossmann fold flavoprotein
MHYDTIVIGAGAAGLLAATMAAERGRRTLLLEKNARPGVKILMSGGTRCNLTHATDRRGIVEAFGSQGPFLHSALARLSPDDVVDLVEAEGVATKVEPGGKIFPVSNRADDVLAALVARLNRSGAELRMNAAVEGITYSSAGFQLQSSACCPLPAAGSVIITTGGLSYPGCGTTGDGYAWAEQFGHTLAPTRPALTPLTTNADWVRRLMGVTIDDVTLTLFAGNELRERKRGSTLLTHFGLSGPPVLDLSREVSAQPQAAWTLTCDFLPSINEEQLIERFTRDVGKRTLSIALAELLPRRLAEELLVLASLPAERRLAELSKAERSLVLSVVKQTPISISGALGYKKAEVTAGGVALDEVDSRTMQSRRQPGLFFAGEVLDLDGPIGGYNFQAAFSTGALAGDHA